MAPHTRVRLTLDERRARLLDLGIELFSTRGYDDLAVDTIAAAASMSKGLLYHYFPSKRHFYIASLGLVADQLSDAVAADTSQAPVQRLLSSLGGYLGYVSEQPAAYTMLVRAGLGADPEVAAVVDNMRARLVGQVLGDLGLVDPPPLLRLAVRGWVGYLEGTCLEWEGPRDVALPQMLHLLALGLTSVVTTTAQLDPAIRLPAFSEQGLPV